MFKSLREKLKGFKKKAEEELEEVIVAEVVEGEVDESELVDAELVEVVETPEEKKERSKKKREEAILGKKLKARVLDEVLEELEFILLESDVALPVVEAITSELKKELEGTKIRRSKDVGNFIEDALKNAIRSVLSTTEIVFDEFIAKHKKPVVIMFVGVNGTGKTTTIAKLVHYLRKKGFSSVIAASDTFRAGAIEQLEVHANRLGVKLIKHQTGGDPAAVAYDAVEHARARNRDVVLIDTAGRMQTNKNLMDEMKKIKRVAKPDMIIFVGDSLAGNDAVEQASKFNEVVGIHGAILSKIDSDARGGAALSIAHAVGKPILFVGTGQGYDDLVPFSADWMVNRLFGED